MSTVRPSAIFDKFRWMTASVSGPSHNRSGASLIKKTKQGYIVKSEGGKNLSKPTLSKAQAAKRLAQVEYWKRKVNGR